MVASKVIGQGNVVEHEVTSQAVVRVVVSKVVEWGGRFWPA